MSESHQRQDAKAPDANLAAFILILFFVIVAAVLSGYAPIALPESQPAQGREIALSAPTATLLPTNTPQPPTLTPTSISTATPIPSSTVLPTAMPAAAVVEQPANANTASAADPALVAQGQQLFLTCTGCHGPDARGLPNLGKDLVSSEFVHSLSDADLLTFVKTGRPMWDPLNTTGIDMPARGGNPTLTDDDILAIIAYLRSLAAG